jgi:hypothetical protein
VGPGSGRIGARWDLLSIPSAAEIPLKNGWFQAVPGAGAAEPPWREGAGIWIGELQQPFVEPEITTGHVCQAEFLLDASATGTAHAGA